MSVCLAVPLTVLVCWAGAVLITTIKHYRTFNQQRELRYREYVLQLHTVDPDSIGTNGKGEEVRLVRE